MVKKINIAIKDKICSKYMYDSRFYLGGIEFKNKKWKSDPIEDIKYC